jgi:hypothetical protein
MNPPSLQLTLRQFNVGNSHRRSRARIPARSRSFTLSDGGDETIAAAYEVAHFGPVEARGINLERHPAVLSNVGSAKKSGIVEEEPLQFHFDLDADAELPFIFLEDAESLGVCFKSRMTEGNRLGGPGEREADFAKPR